MALNITVTTSGVGQATAQLNLLRQSLVDLGAVSSRTVALINNVSPAITALGNIAQSAATQVNSLTTSIGTLNPSLDSMATSLQRVASTGASGATRTISGMNAKVNKKTGKS